MACNTAATPADNSKTFLTPSTLLCVVRRAKVGETKLMLAAELDYETFCQLHGKL
jgi:hypothetical protein